MKSNPHWKQIRHTAGNVNQTLTLMVQGPSSPNQSVQYSVLLKLGVEILFDKGLCQTFPSYPHNTFGSAKVDRCCPSPSEPTHHLFTTPPHANYRETTTLVSQCSLTPFLCLLQLLTERYKKKCRMCFLDVLSEWSNA